MGWPERRESAGERRFERRERLGAGASGEVWLAWDRELRRTVALKTLRSPSPRSLLRFKREFRALADLSHRNLVGLLGLEIDRDGWHIVLEPIRGVSLLEYIRGASVPPERSESRSVQELTPQRERGSSETHGAEDDGPVAVNRASRIEATSETRDASRSIETTSGIRDASRSGQGEPSTSLCSGAAGLDEAGLRRLRGAVGQLVEGLQALHARGVLHRDVKPSNVLVEADGRVVVLDFGLVAGPGEWSEVGFAGTPAYAAPEQLAGEPVDEASDLHAVGVILFEALAGRLPFSFDGDLASLTLRKRQFDAPDLRTLAPGTPPELADLTARLLARTPRARPDAAATLRALGHTPGEGAGSTLFVGRDEELGRLQTALDRVRTGAFEARWLVGPSGVGKSALAQRFGALARQQGAWFLEGRCYAAEQVGFRGFDALVDGLARRLARLPEPEVEALLGPDRGPLARLFPVLSGTILTPPPLESPRQARWQAFEALRGVLGRLAARAPVVLLLDDVQWLDEDGRELLMALAEDPAPPVLLLATARGEATETLRALVPRGEVVEVAALSLWETTALLERLARLEGEGLPREELEGLAAAAAGEPLLARELWRSQRRGQRAEEALGARVEALEPGARAMLQVLALGGRPLRSDVVVEAAGLEEGDGSRALRELRCQQLVRVVEDRGEVALELFHDRLREALLEGLDGAPRREGHRRVAAALLARGVERAEPAALLWHLAEAGEGARGVTLALDAARRARGVLAFERAAALARAGLGLGPGLREAAALREELSLALIGAGRGCEAARILEQRAAEAPPERQGVLLQEAAEQWLTSGELAPGFAALRGALGGGEDPLRRGLLSLAAGLLGAKGRAWALERAPGLPVWRRRSQQARPLERELDAVRTVAFGLGMIDNLRAATYHARALELALRLGDPRRLGEVLATEALFRGSLGTPERRAAAALLAEAQRIAPGDEGVAAWIRGARAALAAFDAPTGAAIDELERSEKGFHGGIRAAGWARSSLFLVRSLSRRMAGDFLALRRDVQARIRDAEARGDRYLAVSLRRGSSTLWLAAGDPEGLREELRRCPWPGPESGVHLQHWMALDAEGELALYEGRVEPVLERFQEERRGGRLLLLSRLQRVRTLLAGLEGRLLLAQGSPGREGRVAALARRLDREQVPHARVQAALLRAALAHRGGDRRALRRELALAIPLAETSGLRVQAACAALCWRALSLGDLPGADPERFFQEQRVYDPARLVALYVPGLGK